MNIPLPAQRKIVAVMLFAVLFFGYPYVVTKNLLSIEVATNMSRLAIVGIICVLAARYLGNFTGQAWLLGRIGTHIHSPTHPVLIEFFGWIMLALTTVVLVVVTVVR